MFIVFYFRLVLSVLFRVITFIFKIISESMVIFKFFVIFIDEKELLKMFVKDLVECGKDLCFYNLYLNFRK